MFQGDKNSFHAVTSGLSPSISISYITLLFYILPSSLNGLRKTPLGAICHNTIPHTCNSHAGSERIFVIKPEKPGFKLSLVPLSTCTSAAHELPAKASKGSRGSQFSWNNAFHRATAFTRLPCWGLLFAFPHFPLGCPSLWSWN